ncbi:MAG: hypothetical protein WKG00_25930 [Polyangiaceae bacterium]
MPLFVIQVRCSHCSEEHPTGMVLKLDDGPLAKESVSTFAGEGPIPPDLKILNTVFVCPLTGQSYRPESNDHVLIVPNPYRL